MNRPVVVTVLLHILSILMVCSAHAAHFPDPVPISEVMTLTAAVTVDGSPLAAGDEVAAYSVHPVPSAPLM